MKYQKALDRARNMTGSEFVTFLERNFYNSIYKTNSGVFLTNNAVGNKHDTSSDRHSSVFIPNSYDKAGYYRFSTNESGDNISLLTNYLNIDFKQAVEMLSNEKIEHVDTNTKNIYSKKKEFVPPSKHKDNSNVVKYLKKRALSNNVINFLINKGIVYATKEYGNYENMVFYNPKNMYGEVKSINANYRWMVEGSSYGGYWCFGAKNPINIYVCEASMDAISLFEIHRMNKCEDIKNNMYVSMSGLKDSVLCKLKAEYPDAQLYIATDNDEKGNLFAKKYKEYKRTIPITKDFNEDLQLLKYNNKNNNLNKQNKNSYISATRDPIASNKQVVNNNPNNTSIDKQR